MQNSRNTYIQYNTIYLHSRHYFTSSNCIFMQLQGIVFTVFNFKEIIYLLTVKEISILSNNIFIHKKYNHSRQLYSDTKLYSFQRTVSVRSRRHILVQRNIFIQGNYINSRKYIYLRNIYLFKLKAICSFKETIFIEHCCIRGIAEIFIQKLSPANL